MFPCCRRTSPLPPPLPPPLLRLPAPPFNGALVGFLPVEALANLAVCSKELRQRIPQGRIWHAAAVAERNRTLNGHTDSVASVAPLGNRLLASGSRDQTSRIWNTESGELLHTLLGHTHSVLSVVPLGNRLLASGSDDRTIRIWNTESGALL